MVVILNASPTFSMVQAAWVSTLVGGVPFFSSPADSAMEKHAACAAASSSSGFEPGASSKRVPKLNGALIAPELPLKLPLPPFRPPSQVALALRVGIYDLR